MTSLQLDNKRVMRFSLLLLCIALIEGRTWKKNDPKEINSKLPNRIETPHEEEKWKEESPKDKSIRYSVTIDSGTARCSLKKCAHQDLTCFSYGQERQMSEDSQTSTKRVKAFRSKCTNPKNPFCIHDIWTGKREENLVTSDDKSPLIIEIECTLCDPEDEYCLLTMKIEKGIFKRSLAHDMAKTNSGPEKVLGTSSSNANHVSYSSRPAHDCDFRRDVNCKQERRFEARPGDRDIILQKFQTKPKLPTTTRKKKCKGRPNQICRWRPQPIKERRQKSVSDSYATSGLASSSLDNTEYNVKNKS